MSSMQLPTNIDHLRDVLFATLDYLAETAKVRTRNNLVDAGFDRDAAWKQQIERQYKKGYDALAREFDKMVKPIRIQGDLGFNNYIRTKTGHTIDIFGNVRERIDSIIAQKEIRTEEEMFDVVTMLSILTQENAPQEKIDVLTDLQRAYAMKGHAQDGRQGKIFVGEDGVEYVSKRARFTETTTDDGEIISSETVEIDDDDEEFESAPETIIPATREELDRAYQLAVAAATYNLEEHPGHKNMPADNPFYNHNRQYLRKAQRDYEAGRIEGLNWIFNQLSKTPKAMGWRAFNSFVKDKTGIDIDIFEGVEERANAVLAKGKIENNEEKEDVFSFGCLLGMSPEVRKKRDQLRKLWETYERTKSREANFRMYRRTLPEVYSEDKSRRVTVHESGMDRHSACTDLSVSIPRKGGCNICLIYGTDLDVRVTWKNNNLIQVETQKGEIYNTQWSVLELFGETINVEYLER